MSSSPSSEVSPPGNGSNSTRRRTTAKTRQSTTPTSTPPTPTPVPVAVVVASPATTKKQLLTSPTLPSKRLLKKTSSKKTSSFKSKKSHHPPPPTNKTPSLLTTIAIGLVIIIVCWLAFTGLIQLWKQSGLLEEDEFSLFRSRIASSISITSIPSEYLSPLQRNEFTKRQIHLMENILRATGDDSPSLSKIFLDPTTPQYKAREWILFRDKKHIYSYYDGRDNVVEEAMMQRYIMAVFYFSLGGPTWKVNQGWPEGTNVGVTEDSKPARPLYTTNECDWHGVTCNLRKQVTMIWLRENNLKGTIPDELGILPILDTIVLSTNHIQGTLPLSTFSVKRLRQIDVHENEMTGTIPPKLYEFGQMEYLGLYKNDFRGTISSRVRLLQKLQTLYLHGNRFSGSIPEEIGLLGKIGEIAFENNQFTGHIPTTIGNLAMLKWFSVQYNQMVGTIPTEFGLLKHLATLHLYENKFRGTVHESICQLTKTDALKELYTDCRAGPTKRVSCQCCSACCSPEGCFRAVLEKTVIRP